MRTEERKFTYNEFLMTIEAFQSVPFQKLLSENLPTEVALWLKKVVKFVEARVQDYEESRLEIVEDYAARDEEGNMIFTNEEKTMIKLKEGEEEKFNEKISKLLTTQKKFETPVITEKKLTESTSGSNIFSVYILNILEKFID